MLGAKLDMQAASRLERGTTTCVHCRGQGTQDCENCSGRGLASPKQPKSNAGKLANKLAPFAIFKLTRFYVVSGVSCCPADHWPQRQI